MKLLQILVWQFLEILKQNCYVFIFKYILEWFWVSILQKYVRIRGDVCISYNIGNRVSLDRCLLIVE